jgi:hypothetical protein
MVALTGHLTTDVYMNATTVSLMISFIGVIVSILVSTFIAGVGVGGIKGDIHSMSERLARIEGMFTLKLKDPSEH